MTEIIKTEIEDKFIIESSHPITLPKILKGDVLFDANYIHEPTPKHPSEGLLENAISPEELLKKQEVETKEVVDERRALITKVKVIAMDMLGKHPVENSSYFTAREKRILMKHMEDVLQMSEDDITTKFNLICNETLFNKESKFENLPVYSTPLRDA
jgi:hypothetical protein